jgi:hypothetical protein
MSTLTVQVDNGGRDGFEDSGGVMNLTGVSLNVDQADEWGIDLWTGVSALHGATINSAVANYQIIDGNNDEPDVTFWGNDVDNAADPGVGAGDISGRTKTTASVAWSNANLGIATPTFVAAPSMLSIVNEMNASGFLASGKIALLYTSTSDNSARDFSRFTYNNNPADAAIFEFDYTAAGGGDDGTAQAFTDNTGYVNSCINPPTVVEAY